MTDGNTYAINKHLDEREDWDALQEVTTELEQAEARIEELEAENEKLRKALEIYDREQLLGQIMYLRKRVAQLEDQVSDMGCFEYGEEEYDLHDAVMQEMMDNWQWDNN